MKKIFFLSLIFCQMAFIFAQNQNECEEKVKDVFKIISENELEKIESYLSEDFTISNQKGNIARMILKQLVPTLGKVEKYLLTEKKEVKNKLILSYDVEYEKLGKKKAEFVFDENNKIFQLELLKTEVKILDNDKNKFEYSDKNIIEIPFRYVSKLIVIKAKVNGVERDFLFDTGSPVVLLNSKYFDNNENEEKKIISGHAKGVGGTVSGINAHKVDIDFYGITIKNQYIMAADISHLEKSLSRLNIYGLIGYDFIKEYDILFDYKNKIIKLIKPNYWDDYKREELNKRKFTAVSFGLKSHIPVLDVKMNDKIYRMGLDSGAEANLIEISLFDDFRFNLKEVSTDSLRGANKEAIEVKTVKIRELYIGKIKYKNLETVFSDISHLNKGYSLNINGLIGYPFLSKQLTLLSFKRKEIVIIK